jgi:hypothetical protein
MKFENGENGIGKWEFEFGYNRKELQWLFDIQN